MIIIAIESFLFI